MAIAQAVGTDVDDMIPFCASMELLHNATLVHADAQFAIDDVEAMQPCGFDMVSIKRSIAAMACFVWRKNASKD